MKVAHAKLSKVDSRETGDTSYWRKTSVTYVFSDSFGGSSQRSSEKCFVDNLFPLQEGRKEFKMFVRASFMEEVETFFSFWAVFDFVVMELFKSFKFILEQ